MKMNVWYKYLIIIGMFFLTSVHALAFNPGTNENLILFDSQGQIIATYHLNDLTVDMSVSASDYKVLSEEYTGGPLSTPTFHTTLVPVSSSTYALPNMLEKTLPSPPLDIPKVSLFSFDDAIFTSTTSTRPGISFSPSPGIYSQTIVVSIKANPSTAIVQYQQDGSEWQNAGNTAQLYIYKTSTLTIRAMSPGPVYSNAKQAIYTINRTEEENPEMVDSDKDGIPDSWEILMTSDYGFNPLKTDSDKDTDNDGISDFNEILRGFDPNDPCVPKICLADIQSSLSGSDPPTEEDLLLLATIGSLHPDYDKDEDGWSDWDETELRGTQPDDPDDKPTARRFNEVERKLAGNFFDISDTGVPGLNYKITSFGSDVLAQGISTSSGAYGNIRIPVGEPAIIRAAGLPDLSDPLENFIIKRYIPVTRDLAPADMTTAWNSPEEWESLYVEFLAANLVEDVAGFDVRPSDYYPLAILEREFEILEGLEDVQGSSIHLLLGSQTNVPALTTLIEMQALLTLRTQSMNAHIQDIILLLAALESSCTTPPLDLAFLSDANTLYQTWTSGDDKTLESKIADLFQEAEGQYLAGLMLEYTFSQINGMPQNICDILNASGDLDSDGITNGDEVPTIQNPSGNSNPFSGDTDGDGINDLADNCPSNSNPGQEDLDNDGIGDVCDPDIDGDYLSNGMESAFGSNPFNIDTDGDGETDYEEWLAYSNPGIAILFTMLESPTKMSFQTIGGTIPIGVSDMEVKLNGNVQSSLIFNPLMPTWTCDITGVQPGLNMITIVAEDSAGSIGFAGTDILRIEPETLLVPDEYATIQAAIDASDNGDRVLVSPGTYEENIDFTGKLITVMKVPGKDSAIIDGQGFGSVVTFDNKENQFSKLTGFIITDGAAEKGAGIYLGTGTGPVVTNNTIFNNAAFTDGGGIYAGEYSNPAIINNTLDSNSAVRGGGIFLAKTSLPVIENNTITNSSLDSFEIWGEPGASPLIDFNNLWNTYGQGVYGVTAGLDNIFTNPLFNMSDYRLDPMSPLIDMGHEGALHIPDIDQDGKPRILDGNGDDIYRVDMGAYEFGDPCEGDISGDGDGDVDGVETSVFASEFGRTDCSEAMPCAGDLNNDGKVDEIDLGIFADDFGRMLCP